MERLFTGLEFYGIPAGILLLAILSGLIVYLVFVSVAGWFVRKYEKTIAGFLVRHSRGPLKLFFPVIAVYIVLPFVDLSPRGSAIIDHILSIAWVFTFAWMLIGLAYVFEDYVAMRLNTGRVSEIEARKIQTQVHFFKRIAVVAIVVVSSSVILITFDTVRQLGETILASAGIAGIILGFAAQNTLGTLFAGLQIAITQPIRIGDSVIIEGEFGTVEDITLTYVILRLWDLRRLVLPIKYFIEKPFQNWTMTSSELLGAVLFYLDFTAPLDELRKVYEEIIQASPLWDGKTTGMQVTNLTDKTMEVRALVGAANSGDLFTLRCEVREKIITYLRENYPESLPRFRTETSAVEKKPTAES